LATAAGAWLSASEEAEDVTQLSAERWRVGDGEGEQQQQEQEEDRHPAVSTVEASSESSALAASAPAGEHRLWSSARTSCARRSTDCRYLPCASILSCRCRCTCHARMRSR